MPLMQMLPFAPIVCHDSETTLSQCVPVRKETAPCAPQKSFAVVFGQLLAETRASGVAEKLFNSSHESQLLINRESIPALFYIEAEAW